MHVDLTLQRMARIQEHSTKGPRALKRTPDQRSRQNPVEMKRERTPPHTLTKVLNSGDKRKQGFLLSFLWNEQEEKEVISIVHLCRTAHGCAVFSGISEFPQIFCVQRVFYSPGGHWRVVGKEASSSAVLALHCMKRKPGSLTRTASLHVPTAASRGNAFSRSSFVI